MSLVILLAVWCMLTEFHVIVLTIKYLSSDYVRLRLPHDYQEM